MFSKKFKYALGDIRIISDCQLTEEKLEKIIEISHENMWYGPTYYRVSREVFYSLKDEINLREVDTKYNIFGKLIIKIVL